MTGHEWVSVETIQAITMFSLAGPEVIMPGGQSSSLRRINNPLSAGGREKNDWLVVSAHGKPAVGLPEVTWKRLRDKGHVRLTGAG